MLVQLIYPEYVAIIVLDKPEEYHELVGWF